MSERNETVTTYQFGDATVRIYGDPDRLDREKLKRIFSRFMTGVYETRDRKSAEGAQPKDGDQGA